MLVKDRETFQFIKSTSFQDNHYTCITIFYFSWLQRVFAGDDLTDDVITNCSRDCSEMLADQEFLQTLRNHKFDIALVDVFVLNKCLVLITYILDLPMIYVSSVPEPLWSVRVPALPSVTPGGVLPFTEDMSFKGKN